MNKVKVEKLSQTFLLSLGEYEIKATIDDEGIVLRTHDGHEYFEFENSDSDTLEAVGTLIAEAGRLNKKEAK